MFENLELLLFKNKLTKHDLADLIGMKYNTLLTKMSGKQQFRLDEVLLIKNVFSEYSIEYLFATDNAKRSGEMVENEDSLNKGEAVHVLGHIYGMLQYAQLHNNLIEHIEDEEMIYILKQLQDIIQKLHEDK